MSEPTKEELLDFMRKHGLEKVDSITNTESAIRHFRCTSKVYKEQRNTLNSKLNKSYEDNYKLEGQLHDMTKQHDTLIDDVKNLREQCKEYVQDASKYINLLSEFSQHIGNKPSSSTYKYFRAKLDDLNITEDK